MKDHRHTSTTSATHADKEKFTVEVKKVIFRNPDNDWTVAAAAYEGGDITLCGVMPILTPHETILVSGTWQEHARFGRQFQVEVLRPVMPRTVEGIEKYLSRGYFRGIGKSTARKITAVFGTETLKIIKDEPQRLLTVKNVSRKVLYNLIAQWQEHHEQAEILAELSDYHIPLHLAQTIYRKYGEQARQIVQRDPYRLPFTIRGLGFLTADKIGLALGIEPKSTQRLRGALNYFLQKGEERGHCFLTEGQLLQQLAKNLQMPRAEFQMEFLAALRQAEEENLLVCAKLGQNGQTAHYRASTYMMEANTAKYIETMLATSTQARSVARELPQLLAARRAQLSDEQVQAVQKFFQHRLTVLTGASGTGKTSTVQLIVELARELELSCVLCAPTGRAACRLEELTKVEAKTIHRLLEWQPQREEFSRNAQNRLDAELIVVDEASMLDIALAEAILAACSEQARMLLVGDVNQLPAVGAGNFLHDLLQCGALPVVQLSHIFRQHSTSQIIHNAHLIIQGKSQGYTGGREFIFCEEQDSEHIVAQIKRWLQEFPQAQVLAPIYNGTLGIDHLNSEIRNWLHGGSCDKLQVRDKVIQIVNNYTLNVYNGDIGYVRGVGKDELTVDFNGKLVIYPRKHYAELKLAYAISIHKSQGSEFETAIMPVIKAHTRMLNRNLIYTAITRAKKKMLVIGNAEVFKSGARRNYEIFRQTRLQQLLRR